MPLAAQTIRPVVVEYKGEARARFEIVNDTLFPLNAVVEPKSFLITEDGEPIFQPLDSSIHLRLSAMSFRIPPRQTYFVFYEARAEKLPAWFVIYTTLGRPPSQSGLNVEVELPHTVYLLQREPLQKSDVRVRVDFQPNQRQVIAHVANIGPRLGRVLGGEVSSRRRKQPVPGFPLLPSSQRRLLVAWDGEEQPERLLLRFRNFTIQERLDSSQE